MPGTTLNGDHWIPIGLEAQFPARSAHPVVANGEPLVVWRDGAGHLHVWEDRCPHRGMRLSFGFVRGETLTCLYHGWRYGGDGSCKHIPAHPDLEPPETICTRTYENAVSCGFVFAAPNGTKIRTAPARDGVWFPVRSIFVPLSHDDIWQHVMAGQTPLGETSLTPDGGVLIGEVGDGDKIALAMQPVSSEKTGLHLAAMTADRKARLSLARKLLRLRAELERL